jgi:hypothetical protein
MQQQIGLCRLLEGRLERRHQGVRQVADETDRVGQHYARAGPSMNTRREVVSRVANKLVGGIGARLGQGVEQRALAGVGVTHQGNSEHLAANVRARRRTCALLLQLPEAVLEQGRPACRAGDGRFRAASRRGRAGRCRPSAVRGGSSRAPGGWPDAAAGLVLPAACLHGCARAGRICRGSGCCDR